MTRNLVLLVVGILVAAFLFRLGLVGPAPDDASPVPETQRVDDSTGTDGGPGELAPLARVEPDAGQGDVGAVAGQPVPVVSAPADGLARIVGRFVLPGGEPAAGVELLLHGEVANPDRGLKFGTSGGWIDPRTMTDADGRFVIAFDPPPSCSFRLFVETPQYPRQEWLWFDRERGSFEDIGEQVIFEPPVIEGRVTRVDGASTGVAWKVVASNEMTPSGGAATSSGMSDPATGQFRIRRIAPGPFTLTGYCDAVGWLDEVELTAEPGERVEADLVFDGPDLTRSIAIKSQCPRFRYFHAPVNGRMVVRAEDGTEYEAHAPGPLLQLRRADDLPPGSYTVEITSEVHAPWSITGVQPGQTVLAELQGSANLRLRVVDDGTGAPIERYRLLLRFERRQRSQRTAELVERGAEPPADGLFTGLPAWHSTLIIDALDHALQEVPLGRLVAEETREVEVRLVRVGSGSDDSR